MRGFVACARSARYGRRPGSRSHRPVDIGTVRFAWLIAAGAAFLLIGSAAFAANDVARAQPAASAVQADEEIGALLLKIEQQIANGRTFFPANDSATHDWPRVMQRASPATPDVVVALADFAARMRKRAAEELAAGHTDVSIDLTLFEDLATTLLTNVAAASASASDYHAATSESATLPEDRAMRGPVAEAPGIPDYYATKSFDAAANPPRPADPPAPSATDARPAPVPLGNTAASDAPTPAAGNTALTMAVPTVPRAASAPAAQDGSAAAMYASRGDAMLAIKDISAARKFYEFGANAGSARAAMALAGTYDPDVLLRVGAVGVRPDPALAANWYHSAAALGHPDAEARLRTLSTQAAK
jgi:hypothetical protein